MLRGSGRTTMRRGELVKKKKLKKAKPSKPDEQVLDEIKALVATRLRMANRVMEAQDDLTKEVIENIRDRLRVAGTGYVKVNGKPVKLEHDVFDNNLLFLACEIVSDLALLDIQVANFKFSPAWCAECKIKIAKVAKHDGRKAKKSGR